METPLQDTRTRDPEVAEHTARRQFSASYKLKLLEEADRCTSLGEVGALLRREGLYSSHLSTWRKQRREGALVSMLATTRGRPAKYTTEQREIERLQRDNERLRIKLAQAEKIIEVQKKLSEVLGVTLKSPASEVNE